MSYCKRRWKRYRPCGYRGSDRTPPYHTPANIPCRRHRPSLHDKGDNLAVLSQCASSLHRVTVIAHRSSAISVTSSVPQWNKGTLIPRPQSSTKPRLTQHSFGLNTASRTILTSHLRSIFTTRKGQERKN